MDPPSVAVVVVVVVVVVLEVVVVAVSRIVIFVVAALDVVNGDVVDVVVDVVNELRQEFCYSIPQKNHPSRETLFCYYCHWEAWASRH